MRISTITMFESSMGSMNRQQSEFLKVGQQLATGRRVVNPSDDPQAASRAVAVSQSLAMNSQYADARISARNALSQEESVLNSVADATIAAKKLIVQAGNGTLSDADRSSIASDLKGIYETLISQANTTDGNGNYLFGGYKDDSAPFVREAGGVEYRGSDQVRAQQIDSSRQMPVGNTGREIFQSTHNSAGYVAEADNGNTGSVAFTGPTPVDATDPGYGDSYEIAFADDGAGGFTYTVTNTTTGNPVAGHDGEPYADGQTLSFGGISITLEGTPEVNDEITMEKAPDSSLFTALENAIAVLDSETSTDADKAALQNTLSTVSRQLDNSLDNVLTIRASAGARINELDIVDSVGANRSINYEQTLSDLVDLNYVEGISNYLMQQMGLQASQKAFMGMQNMSLFNHL